MQATLKLYSFRSNEQLSATCWASSLCHHHTEAAKLIRELEKGGSGNKSMTHIKLLTLKEIYAHLVGTRMSTLRRTPAAWSCRNFTAGNRYPKVLPLPGSATACTSLPASTGAQHLQHPRPGFRPKYHASPHVTFGWQQAFSALFPSSSNTGLSTSAWRGACLC